jgi:hypothetical protein
MSASVLQIFYRADVQHDWTQQELAEFYRVETVLIQSGVSLETDRGLSDEGDPWFIFCRPYTGDVVVHFARHGKEYIAAGGGLDRVLRGRSFREIIDSFMSRQPVVVSGNKGAETSVFLHPAALLSAFVATAFFLFTSAEAEASSTDPDSKDATIVANAGQARMPTAFQSLIEAAGLAGNRDAWIALSTVAIAFSVGVADAHRDGETSNFPVAQIQLVGGGEYDTESLLRSGHEGSGEPQAPIEWASININSKSESLINEEQAEAGSIIPALDSSTTTPRFTQSDLLEKQGTVVRAEAGASMFIEPGVLQARSLDDSLGFAVFAAASEPAAEMLGVRSGDLASEAYSLVFESLEFTQHWVASNIFTQNLINAIATTTRAEGWSSDSINAEINFAADDSVRNDNEIGANIETTFNAGLDMQASAVQALEWFAQAHPNFKIVSLGRNVVVFDWSTINEVQVSIELHSWTMDDGSTINIIGTLPDAFSTLA